MAASVLIPIADYLKTSYRPDREYIDGELLERNMGKWEHSRIQAYLAWWFIQNEPNWNVQAATEWRTQVSRTRIRIPDLVLVAQGPQDAVLAHPPVLIVEILSPDDRDAEIESRARDYRHMGVETIWIIDPQTRTGRVGSGGAWTGGRTPGGARNADLRRARETLRRSRSRAIARLGPGRKRQTARSGTVTIKRWTNSPCSPRSSKPIPPTPLPATASPWSSSPRTASAKASPSSTKS